MKVNVKKHCNAYLYKQSSFEEIVNRCSKIINDMYHGPLSKRFNESMEFYHKNHFHYEECWNLDTSVAAFVLPRLIYFKSTASSIPNDFIEYDDNIQPINTEEASNKWSKVLDDMIEAFYRYLFIDSLEIDDTKERAINEKIINRGIKLFAKYFQSLWD